MPVPAPLFVSVIVFKKPAASTVPRNSPSPGSINSGSSGLDHVITVIPGSVLAFKSDTSCAAVVGTSTVPTVATESPAFITVKVLSDGVAETDRIAAS